MTDPELLRVRIDAIRDTLERISDSISDMSDEQLAVLSHESINLFWSVDRLEARTLTRIR
tara:strand:+ start:146 stop:325 length:180 start_codon:yes stop_codon:yes gene_type:complete